MVEKVHVCSLFLFSAGNEQKQVTVHTPLSRGVFPHAFCGNPEGCSAKML